MKAKIYYRKRMVIEITKDKSTIVGSTNTRELKAFIKSLNKQLTHKQKRLVK